MGRVLCVTSKTTRIARTNRAFVRAVAGFAAFLAHRSLHSRAIVSVVALRLERAFAIAALVSGQVRCWPLHRGSDGLPVTCTVAGGNSAQ